MIAETDSAAKATVKRLDFVIYSEKAGVFTVIAKLGPAEVQRVAIEVDDLLERRDNGIQNLELDELTLNVNSMYNRCIVLVLTKCSDHLLVEQAPYEIGCSW